MKITLTTQSNLQIQCNPYQITTGIFHRTRTKNFTTCMETQKTPNCLIDLWVCWAPKRWKLNSQMKGCSNTKPGFLSSSLPPSFPSFLSFSLSLSFSFLNLFYSSIVNLQCCVNFCCTAKWDIYMCIYIYICVYIYIYTHTHTHTHTYIHILYHILFY